MSSTTTTVKADPPPAGMPAAPPLPDDLEQLLRRLRMPHTQFSISSRGSRLGQR